MNKIKVFKFGGASVRGASHVKNIGQIIKSYKKEEHSLLVVISAMGKTTANLEAVWKAFLDGKDHVKLLDDIYNYHYKIISELFEDGDIAFRQFEISWEKLESNFNIKYADENQLYDQIISFGEIISTQIVAQYLISEGIKAAWVDARKYISTDEQWREGNVNWSWTQKAIEASLTKKVAKETVITQGFIGGTLGNQTTTLGKEGSDFSAAIFAHCLDAESVTVWKDVPGILSGDPKRFRDVEKYDYLNYKDAAEMTYYGASVIHPKTIRPLALKNIPLYVKSFVDPEKPGTCIGNENSKKEITSIICKTNQSLISFEEKDLLNVNRLGLDIVFHELQKQNIKINLISNSAITVSVCANTDLKKFEKILALFEQHFNIKIANELELITIKGNLLSTKDKLPFKNPLVVYQTKDTYQMVVSSNEG